MAVPACHSDRKRQPDLADRIKSEGGFTESILNRKGPVDRMATSQRRQAAPESRPNAGLRQDLERPILRNSIWVVAKKGLGSNPGQPWLLLLTEV